MRRFNLPAKGVTLAALRLLADKPYLFLGYKQLGYKQTEEFSLASQEQRLRDSVRIVLLRTSHPGNIGAVARAMKNMGFHQLYLVDPKEFPSDQATSRAAGADDVLDHAQVVATIDQAIGACHLVIGASARSRNLVWPLMNPRACAALVLARIAQSVAAEPVQIALLFGNEAHGMSNDELQRCHFHVNVPANPEFSSLNLAMAAQVLCYELRMGMLLEADSASDQQALSLILAANSQGWDEPSATVQELEGFFNHLEQAMIDIGFHDPNKPRLLMNRMRRLFQRAHMDKMEVNILRGVLAAAQKKQTEPRSE